MTSGKHLSRHVSEKRNHHYSLVLIQLCMQSLNREVKLFRVRVSYSSSSLDAGWDRRIIHRNVENATIYRARNVDSFGFRGVYDLGVRASDVHEW